MAGTTVYPRATYGSTDSDLYQVIAQLNKVVTDLETLRAAIDTIADQLDADGTVTDTDYAANAGVASAAVLTAATIDVSLG